MKFDKLFENYMSKTADSDKLQKTADLETIADFLNLNDIPTGAPVAGVGGWQAGEDAVYNNDGEGGFYLSVKVKPTEEGIVLYSTIKDTPVLKRLLFPVHASLVKNFIKRVQSANREENE